MRRGCSDARASPLAEGERTMVLDTCRGLCTPGGGPESPARARAPGRLSSAECEDRLSTPGRSEPDGRAGDVAPLCAVKSNDFSILEWALTPVPTPRRRGGSPGLITPAAGTRAPRANAAPRRDRLPCRPGIVNLFSVLYRALTPELRQTGPDSLLRRIAPAHPSPLPAPHGKAAPGTGRGVPGRRAARSSKIQ